MVGPGFQKQLDSFNTAVGTRNIPFAGLLLRNFTYHRKKEILLFAIYPYHGNLKPQTPKPLNPVCCSLLTHRRTSMRLSLIAKKKSGAPKVVEAIKLYLNAKFSFLFQI